MALSDCYMLRDIQTLYDETILNVYFYQDLLLASIAQNVVESWIADFLPKVQTIQVAEVHHVLVDAVNLADPSNFYEFAQDEVGLNTGENVMPAHNAVNFSLRINSRALRPGSKRYCGLYDEVVDGNFITSSDYIENLEALRVQQSAILLSGVLSTFQPIVVKRVPYEVPGSDPVRTAYRLPEDDGEFVFGNVVDSILSLRVSHQVSRNNGR